MQIIGVLKPKMAIDYLVLNMNKVYLYVDIKNEKAVHIYQSNNFEIEGTLKEHFYTRENIEIAM